jgi:hypothetical protein
LALLPPSFPALLLLLPAAAGVADTAGGLHSSSMTATACAEALRPPSKGIVYKVKHSMAPHIWRVWASKQHWLLLVPP